MNVRKVFAKFYVGTLVVLGLYVFFGSLIGVGIRKVVRENKESPKVVEAIQTEVEEPTKEEVVETPVVEEVTEETPVIEEEVTFTLGDTVINEDYTVTLESARIITDYDEYNTPNENCEFLELCFVVENKADDELFVYDYKLETYVDDFVVEANDNVNAMLASGEEFLSATLASGKKVRGVLCYELSKDWSELEIIFDLDYGDDNEGTLVLSKEQVTK